MTVTPALERLLVNLDNSAYVTRMLEGTENSSGFDRPVPVVYRLAECGSPRKRISIMMESSIPYSSLLYQIRSSIKYSTDLLICRTAELLSSPPFSVFTECYTLRVMFLVLYDFQHRGNRTAVSTLVSSVISHKLSQSIDL